MRSAKILAVAISVVFFGTTSLAGQHGHVAPASHGHATVAHGPSTSHGPTMTGHASGTTHGSSSTHASRSSTHATKPTRPTHSSTATTKPSKTSGTTTTASTTPTTSPVAKKIESHPQLASKVSAMLPAGMTMNEAAAGFKNQGQFIAALHVSQNLGIPFVDLKNEMVTNHNSLGQSIQKLRPTANATTETEKAETEAEHEVAQTTTTTTTTKNAKHHR